MAGAIGPGDWVECVDASARIPYGPPPLCLGSVYRVERVEADVNGWGPGVWIVGIRAESPSGGFYADRFRPIYRPKSELLESLLHKADEPLKVDA